MIPVLVTFVLYVYVVHQANEQSDRLHESMLAKVQADMDARLLSARSVESRLYIDSDVRSLSYVEGEMQNTHAMPQVRLFQELNSLVLSNEAVSGIFVYFPQAHKIVSTNGNMDLSMYYSLYYDENCISQEEFEKLITEKHHYDIHIIRAKGGTFQMIMLLSLPSAGDQKLSFSIGMILSSGMLRSQMTLSEFSTTETQLYLCTQSGSLYNPADGLIEAGNIPDRELAGMIPRFSGESVRMTARESDQTNIRYLMITPERLIHEDVRKLHFVIVLGLLLSIFTGLLLSKHLTTRNFDPVDQLLRTIRSGDGKNGSGTGEDDLVWANREVERLYRDSVNNEQLLKDSRRQVRDYCLLQLLTRGYTERPELLRLSAEAYGVVILKVLDAKDINETELALRTSILRSLFEDHISPRYTAETLEWGDTAVALISVPDQSEDPLPFFREAAEKTQTTVETSLHFSCAVYIGPVAESVRDIPAAYRAAGELDEYRSLLDTNLITASEIEDMQSRYDFSAEDEEKLKNAVSIGDEESALTLIRDVFERNRKAGISVDLYWCLVYAMTGVLIRGANSGGLQDTVTRLRLHTVLMNCRPGNDTEKTLAGLTADICREIVRSRTDTDGDRSFCAELENFIRGRFTDPDLNISTVSHQFNLTPAYLSTRYKRQTGRSLLDLINTSRLDLAEELLKNGATVAEAAERSGFRDSGNLIRAFKKKKGITPGQVRQQGN